MISKLHWQNISTPSLGKSSDHVLNPFNARHHLKKEEEKKVMRGWGWEADTHLQSSPQHMDLLRAGKPQLNT